MVRYCSVNGCSETNYSNKNRKFYRFPSDELRCRYWIKGIGRMDLAEKDLKTLHSSYFVCELHFVDSDRTKRVLKKHAVPTLLLPQSGDPTGTSKYTQTDNSLLYCSWKSQTSAEIPSTSQVSHLAQTTKRKLLELITENAEEADVSPLLKKIIDAQKTIKEMYPGNRHDQEYIEFALNIYFASPIAYQSFSEILGLPNIKTLQSHIALDVSTKYNENLFRSLQSKTRNMNDSEKFCIICANEISLERNHYYQINNDKVVQFHEMNEQQSTEVAIEAFVVMARGIFSDWKQPIAFCFLGKNKNYAELNMWLENLISMTIEIGFNVCALTTDQGSNFISMANNKFASPEEPFFFVKGKKIYYIFDIPHLTKSLRNTLIDYDFAYNDDDGSQQIASWDDIERMYDIEKDKKYKMAFKLTESHIRPNDFDKMQVKYATQVLSRTVAVSISTLVDEGKLDEKCLGTTKFIELINDMFDILNSSSVSNDYKYKNAFNHAAFQTNTLERACRILSKLRIINRNNSEDVTHTVKFIEGFLTSIKAIICLASDLKAAGYNNLFTRRLNQDALEEFFGEVRQQGGNCEPTAIQFLTAFKKLFLVDIVRHSEYANCAEDLDQLLMSVHETLSSLRSENNVPYQSSLTSLQDNPSLSKLTIPKSTNLYQYSETQSDHVENTNPGIDNDVKEREIDVKHIKIEFTSDDSLMEENENSDLVNDNEQSDVDIKPNINLMVKNENSDVVNENEHSDEDIKPNINYYDTIKLENDDDEFANDTTHSDIETDGYENDDTALEIDLEKKIKLEDEVKRKIQDRKMYLKVVNKDNFEKIEVKLSDDIKEYFTMTKFDEQQMEEHILAKERDSKRVTKYRHSCRRCKLGYDRRLDFQRHTDLNHRKTSVYECTRCKMVLSSHDELIYHWREHTLIAQCKLCDQFMYTKKLKSHLYSLHRKKYACKSCSMTFRYLSQFGKHFKETHMNYICDYCNRAFTNENRIIRHIHYFHTPTECKDCKRTLANLKRYREHCLHLHPIKLNRVTPPETRFCKECNKEFPSTAAYRVHLANSLKHSGVKPESAACPECGKVFTRSYSMRNHYKFYHLNESKYHCKPCDKYFAGSGGLNRHNMSVHLNKKAVKDKMCDLCGKGFSSKRILRNHRATHTGEKFRKCMYCTAEFIQKHTMLTHMRTQHKHNV